MGMGVEVVRRESGWTFAFLRISQGNIKDKAQCNATQPKTRVVAILVSIEIILTSIEPILEKCVHLQV